MTLGVAQTRDDNSVDKTIAQADDALYRGKNEGRNRVECVKEKMDLCTLDKETVLN
jgi:PleD family two-component response regulator